MLKQLHAVMCGVVFIYQEKDKFVRYIRVS